MTEKIYSSPDIYQIYIPLPDNPLKNLNCYVLCTEEKTLIIDTGFFMPECLETMKQGLAELGIDTNRKKTELFLTHLHSDHIGLAAILMPKGSTIYMGKIDYEYLNNLEKKQYWRKTEERFCMEGFPKNSISVLRKTNPARSYAPGEPFDAVTLSDGEEIQVGTYRLRCILTPGHTPGHMCLYLEEKKLMFLGDHVLFDITPNITCWHGIEDSLADYIESLKKMKTFAVETPLPAHRQHDQDLYSRIDTILRHHSFRLENTIRVVEEQKGLTAYEIAGKMRWKMRGRNWDEFPMHQKWFAVGETIAHLDYLRLRNLLVRKEVDGIYRYEKACF